MISLQKTGKPIICAKQEYVEKKNIKSAKKLTKNQSDITATLYFPI
jgi:hypothetical protein